MFVLPRWLQLIQFIWPLDSKDALFIFKKESLEIESTPLLSQVYMHDSPLDDFTHSYNLFICPIRMPKLNYLRIKS